MKAITYPFFEVNGLSEIGFSVLLLNTIKLTALLHLFLRTFLNVSPLVPLISIGLKRLPKLLYNKRNWRFIEN